MGDELVRSQVLVEAPEFESTPFVRPSGLGEACVALCTTAGLHAAGEEPYGRFDTRFRVFGSEQRDLVLGHTSQNFDRLAFTLDLNVVYPIDRLHELAAEGVIGSVSPVHAAFVGNQSDETLETILLDSGPAAAQQFIDAGVDVVVLTPVWPVCTLTVCALAHAFEAKGLATVVLSSVRDQAIDAHPPRVLHCEFPLGRPLGVPGDAKFQRRVLEEGLALLEEPSGPVFVEFAEEIRDEADQPLSCPMPPFHDATAHPAVNEAKGLRAAYNRTLAAAGASTVHRVMGPDDVPGVLGELARALESGEVASADLPGSLGDVMLDLRAYYEEAGLALVDHTPAARQLESWLYRDTHAGELMLGVRKALEDAGAEPVEFAVLAPITQ